MFDSLDSEQGEQGGEAGNAAGEAVDLLEQFVDIFDVPARTPGRDLTDLALAVDAFILRQSALITDDERHKAAVAFVTDNPTFASLPWEVVLQVMDKRSGYRNEQSMAERQALRDEGVPDNWEEEAAEYDDVPTSDDL